MGLLLGDLFYSAVCVTRGTVSGVEVFLHPTVSQQDLLVSMSVKNINSGYFFSTDLEGVTCDGTYLKGSEVTHLGTLKQVSMNTENHWKDERIYHIGLFNTDFSNLRPLVGRVIRNETDESDYVSLACAFSVLVDTKFKYSTSLHLSPLTKCYKGLNLGAPQCSQAVLGTQLLLPQPTLWHHHRFSQLLGKFCWLAWGLP